MTSPTPDKQLRLPDHFTEYGTKDIMSNYDHEIEKDVAYAIMDKPLFSRYAGWDFNGKVWYHDLKWHCEVWIYGSYKETYTRDHLQEIMNDVSEKYGEQ